MTTGIRNPILPGFHPDPSITRAGDDYFIATSTFEWFPGVRLHQSKNLRDWQLLPSPLNRISQLDMNGNPDSGGIWAPCLSYDNGTFYLVYTNVKRHNGDFKDAHNYLVTATDIKGPWSEPIYLNSVGFDPSLFHDDDGRKWLVQMIWNPSGYRRTFKNFFAGIMIQEFDRERRQLIGNSTMIFKGSSLGVTEGPHLYKRDGYYYLLTAEGGTTWDHACTMARSPNILGPYELHPEIHLLTAKDSPDSSLQRAGHGDLVATPEGETYLVHLCGRPLTNRGACTLGRETAIQKVDWPTNEWPRVVGGVSPQLTTPLPAQAPATQTEMTFATFYDDFDQPTLGLQYQSLRKPLGDLISLSERAGYLRLYGAESIGSPFTQSLIATRLTNHRQQATCKLDFEPRDFQTQAGLALYYNSEKFIYLQVTHFDSFSKCLVVHVNDNSCSGSYPLLEPISIKSGVEIYLRLQVDRENLYLAYRYDQEDSSWITLPLKLDAAICSDEYGNKAGSNFTGAFFALCCQDISGCRHHADFDFLEVGDFN